MSRRFPEAFLTYDRMTVPVRESQETPRVTSQTLAERDFRAGRSLSSLLKATSRTTLTRSSCGFTMPAKVSTCCDA